MTTVHPISQTELPHRHSIRLKEFDYSQPGGYFVSICLHDHDCLFCDMQSADEGSCGIDSVGAPLAASHPLTLFGQIVLETWRVLPARFQNTMLDSMVIMPNHVHGILHIVSNDAAKTTGAASGAPTTLGGIMRAFKSLSALAVNRKLPCRRNPFWQRNYYEHIIRNDDELLHIREYIRNNPARWAMDRENPDIPLSAREADVPEWSL